MRDSLKWIVMFFFVISFVFGIVGCKEPMQVDTSVNYGSIKGKVLYSNENVNNHSGIQITLVSTDGLRTTEYSSSRGIATKTRSVKDIRTSNISGEYSFENIPVGVYTIYASSNSSLEKAVATNIVVKGKQTVIANDLNLTATGSVRGYVSISDSAGNTESPLGLDVFIAGTSFDGKVGLDGCFELTGIPAKTGYVLCVQKGTSTKIISENLEVRANVSRDIGETYLSSDDFETGAFNWRGSWDYFPENPNKYDAFFYTQDGCSYIFNGSAWDLLAQRGSDGQGINWLGSYETFDDISNPQELDAYYNTANGRSYIYTRWGWEVLTSAGKGINWLGEFSSHDQISDPQYLDAYYNTTDGCSYIYNGWKWDYFTQSGKGINWLGEFSSHDQFLLPQYLDAYYNTTDGCSYIYNGLRWERLAQIGSAGKGINWLGYYSSHDQISDPQYLDAYFNTTDGCSYIYNGWTWELLARTGSDGKGIIWRGSFSSEDEITNPNYLDAYYNTTDGCSYIYIVESWRLLAHSGVEGKGINWRGSHVSASYISDPQYLDAYYDTTDGCSYIYTANGWTLFAKAGADGADGKNIVWRGNFEDANLVENPQELDVYFNTTDGCSYIYTNNSWELLAQAGAAGKSIVWIGSYPNADDIEEPQLLWAFYNITDGCSYIYDGSTWQLLARKGTDGATGSGDGSIRWLGTFANVNEVYEPAPLDAFFNKTDGCSYIYNGTNWVMLAQAGEDGKDGTDGTDGANGKDGEDGKGINWRGSYSTVNDISSPKYLDAYWNTTENCAYVYNGSKWTVLIKGPASGGTGSSSNTNIGSEVGANVVGTTLISWDSTPASGVIRIPNGVTDIAEAVFKNNDKITRVIIPSSVVNIGKSVFYDCDGLTSVEFLGNGLEIIGASAFYDCSNLVTITLPNTLTSIGSSAFESCKKITTVNIPNTVNSIGGGAYRNCYLLRSLTIGSGCSSLHFETFENCDSLVNVTIPDSVISINNTIFALCDNLTTVHVSGNWNKNGNVSNLTISDLMYDNYNFSSTWTRVTE